MDQIGSTSLKLDQIGSNLITLLKLGGGGMSPTPALSFDYWKTWLKLVLLENLQAFFNRNFLTFLLPSRHHPSSWQTRITKTHNYWEKVAIHRPINHHLLLPMENVSIVTSICDCFHLSYFVKTIAYFFPFLPVKQHYFFNFSCKFIHPNYFFQFEFIL